MSTPSDKGSRPSWSYGQRREDEVAAVARLCDAARVPLTARGGGTGYTGGAVPTRGGVVLSLERLNRIIQIDELNLLAIVEPNVITADSATRRRSRRSVLSARPSERGTVGDRRKCRRMRRWTACV